MFKRILVPLDGSRLAERAIPHAAQIARLYSARLTLLQILDPSQHHDTLQSVEPLSWQIRKAEADVSLRSTAAIVRAAGVDVDHILLEGRTPESIVDYANTENIDLIVISTHGAGGLSRWNRSSVVGKVIEKAFTSVLIIRAYQELLSAPAQAAQEAAVALEEASAQSTMEVVADAPVTGTAAEQHATSLDPRTAVVEYNRILVPIDSSRRAECALPVSITLVNGMRNAGRDTSLILATILRPPDIPISQPYPTEIQQLVEQLQQLSRRAINDYMEEIQARVPFEVETRQVEASSIPAALHSIAAEEGVDLVILCAHGQSGDTGWPYGSVAHNYVEYGEKHCLIIQDLHRAQVRRTSAEIAAEKYGRR